MRVGVFDSGVGGITVLTEMKRRWNKLNYLYLGDTAHVPYGSKSPAQIEKLSTDCAKIIKDKNVDILLVACNTASSWAFDAIQEVMWPVPVFGVVEPGVQAVQVALEEMSGSGSDKPGAVLVLATRATVQSHSYANRLTKVLGASLPVIEQACPLLVPMIEEGWIQHPVLHQTLEEYVSRYRSDYGRGVALLGCTHYPWIHTAFEKALPGWKVVNSASAVVDYLERNEKFKKMKTQRTTIPSQAVLQSKKVEWIFTDPEAVPGFAKQIIEQEG